MRRADLNGDGRPDRLRWRWISRNHRNGGKVRLAVHFAGGGKAAIRISIPFLNDPGNSTYSGPPPAGAAQVDGRQGRDVVVLADDQPASFAGYAVIAARGHHLRSLPAPTADGWFVGGTVDSGGSGFTCGRHALIRVSATPKGHAYRIVRARYRWHADGWHGAGRRVTHGQPSDLEWRCRGLGRVSF